MVGSRGVSMKTTDQRREELRRLRERVKAEPEKAAAVFGPDGSEKLAALLQWSIDGIDDASRKADDDAHRT